MNHEPRIFTCFDDHDNDGWGNSTLDREYLEPFEEDDTDLDDESEENAPVDE